MIQITGIQTDEERALYHLTDAEVLDCVFAGERDGESALKESRNLHLKGCSFRLRYPLWHAQGVAAENCEMTEGARAPIWYARNVCFRESKFDCAKLLRECESVVLIGCDVRSPEAGWRCRGLSIEGGKLDSAYFFLGGEGGSFRGLEITGNYPFQYAKGVAAQDCLLDGKDMFWHAKGVTVRNCRVRGEYIGWYSEDLRFEHCEISGSQPFCYCKGLKLIDCELKGDRAFEYSEVEATLRGRVESIENPLAGKIVVDEVGTVIQKNAVYPCSAEIIVRHR